jgi:EmrB/QacA subfamily drug resistance transporter
MPQPSKWTVLALVGTGVFMCTLDTSIVNVSLPTIARHFDVPLGPEVEWVIVAYLVVIAASLLTIGRLADHVGQRRPWLAGLTIFTLGSALCGASPSLAALIAARALQGVGGALLMAVSPAMLTGAFPREERGRALGLNAMIVAFGVSAGPSLGGVLTEHGSWRWIFYVNVPIGVAGLVASARLLDRDGRRGRGRFDVAGAILFAVALGALTAGLSIGNDVGWRSPITLGLIAIGVVAGAIAAWHERRSDCPLLDPSLLRDRVFASATASLVLSFLAAFAVGFLMPFYLEELRGSAPARTGLLMTPFPITVAVVAPFSGRMADRIGTRGLASTGMAFLAVGLALIARLDATSSVLAIVLAQVVAALGSGLFQSPNNSAIMGAAPRERQGVAAGMLATGRVVGQTLSVALAGAVFTTLGGAAAGRALAGGARTPANVDTFVRGFHWALTVSAILAAVGAVISLARGREHRPPAAAV